MVYPVTESRLSDERTCVVCITSNCNIAEIWANVSRTLKHFPFITQYARCKFHHYSCPSKYVIIQGVLKNRTLI
jgi:hypothetical protein